MEENKKFLDDQEEKELADGQALYEMTKTKGFVVLQDQLKSLAFHSWVDPREIDKPGGLSKEEWEWRELNAFHAANNAKELLEWIQKMISSSDYLEKKKKGEVGSDPMRIR